jgi:DNA polymerase-4
MERPSSLVLCCDLDAFFYQVELLRDPTIGGKPVAIQQHSEIICANYEAKAAGVRKRMSSADCRALLGPLGGINVHVHTEPGGRVSYLPYQKASADFFRLLRALPWAGAVVEKGSIDEAYIGISVGAQEAAPTAAAGRALAQQLRDRVQQELGLAASVGVAPNRLLAKLASRLAKPPASGVHVLWTAEEVDAALGACPPSRLPGLGGKAGGGLAALGAASALDMCRFSAAELERALGLPPEKAAKIWGFCRGLDDTPVVDRGPPQSLSVQMSLSPVELPMHPSASRGVPVGGGPPGEAAAP